MNTNFEADRKTVKTICRAYGAYRTEDKSDRHAHGTFCNENYAKAFSVYIPPGACEVGWDVLWSEVVDTVLSGPK